MTAFPPRSLREYALLADGERGALVGPSGEIAWLCAPRWDSDPVFAALIGGTGEYAVTPVGRFVPGGYYEGRGLVRHGRWITEQGVIVCREALALPADPHRLVLLRRVHADYGPARLRLRLAAGSGFDTARTRAPRRTTDGWSIRAGRLRLRWTGAQAARPHPDGSLVADVALDPGERLDLVLEVSDRGLDAPPPDPDRCWRATERAWRAAVPDLRHTYDGRDAAFSYAVLRGLTSPATGGMVAAATTSLPERAEEGRNYDYRYVWIRDQCLAGQAVAACGPDPLLDDAVRFTTARLAEDGPRIAPAYTAAGGRVPDQHTVDLPGYPGGHDQVGNRITRQFQLDAFGEALLLFAAAARHDRLGPEAHGAARTAAAAIAARWREPDAGIWELGPRQWTHSRLICAAGLHAITRPRVAGAAGLTDGLAAEWSALADRLSARAARLALHPSGRWQRSPDDPAPDLALLLPPVRGWPPADDPRTVATLRACREQLTDGHYAYRFRHDERPLAEAEGAFVLCGFLMALAERQQGDAVEAARWFETTRGLCGSAGLFSEEYDIAQRQQRGNLPQAFVHAMLLECAARLAEPPVS
ncbi:glycoside hydrolase family 15 protein [Kitasatospora cathayae]|uniref:Glycoside hydrolase family 15 protein n=1 Tax=Kitasatospora cathayae TaxID=3004092 RepID=A0ABY7PVN6_9ACTN|nr:glycoside hydrolase family 15 protein [Kitasatospora sp. HUAS 3-15]WBP84507.1 glycoside hydrolase family 15 protein [Kitasatospora sp. HUAS 3-15]